MLHATEKVIENGRQIAAHVLEASPFDIEFDAGRFTVVGTDRASPFLSSLKKHVRGCRWTCLQSWMRKLRKPHHRRHSPTVAMWLRSRSIPRRDFVVAGIRSSTISGSDQSAGEGQVHGGFAQGFGQAVMEDILYDDDGQLITGTFMDYAMPRAADLPNLISVHIPCRQRPILSV